MIRIVLTGGGSGGHIFPLVAVAREIRRLGSEQKISNYLTYVGSAGIFRTVIENEDIEAYELPGGKLRAYSSVSNLFDPFKMFFAFFIALVRLFLIMPDVVFSKGGTGSVPVVLAARVYRIPVMVHDSDAIPGKSNVLSGRFAARIAVSFDSAAAYFPSYKTAFTGNPIRSEIAASNSESRASLKQKLGFAEQTPLLLIIGGSQGATRINDFVFNALSVLLSKFQILHQVGTINFADTIRESSAVLKTLPAGLRVRYKAVPFLEDDYATALKAADVIISRASSGAIFEIASVGAPSVLVPLPEAAQNHQRENAYKYAEGGAAIVIEQENLLPEILIEQLDKIIGNEEAYAKMVSAAKNFAVLDAATVIAGEILRIGARA